MPLDNKCRIGPLAGAPPDTCAVVISTETESGFITEDDTSSVCHTPSCPRSAKIQSTLPMMWGQCPQDSGPTDLTSTYSVCSRMVLGGIGHQIQAFRSVVRSSNH
ncbi:uncharacterized protein TNCV_4718301 [Trichonephila clavipes]|nr:uncharacterized protein TNCV_4718301 [Trichonephila clavipes]